MKVGALLATPRPHVVEVRRPERLTLCFFCCVQASPFSIDTALSLYDLEHFEMFWEKTLDTKAIVGWNDSTVREGLGGQPSLTAVVAELPPVMLSCQGSCAWLYGWGRPGF